MKIINCGVNNNRTDFASPYRIKNKASYKFRKLILLFVQIIDFNFGAFGV